jgi:DNA-binding HxlR family transcriptional regulator
MSHGSLRVTNPDVTAPVSPAEVDHTSERCKPANDLLGLVGEKWTVRLVWTLWDGPRRFSEIRRELTGISQRMLTLTLRTLERDGLITRTVTPTVPPRVDYELTALGKSLGERIRPLAEWAFENEKAVIAARDTFDARNLTEA